MRESKYGPRRRLAANPAAGQIRPGIRERVDGRCCKEERHASRRDHETRPAKRDRADDLWRAFILGIDGVGLRLLDLDRLTDLAFR